MIPSVTIQVLHGFSLISLDARSTFVVAANVLLYFRGPFNAKPIMEKALRKSHVNGATMLKLYSYIGIGRYFGACQNLSARGRP